MTEKGLCLSAAGTQDRAGDETQMAEVGVAVQALDETQMAEVVAGIDSVAVQALDEMQMAEAVASGPSETMLALINNVRRQNRLQPVRLESRLGAAATAHSQDMARNNFLSHTGSDGSSMGTRLTRVGYSFGAAGENIAAGQQTVEQTFQSWMNSPGHRANILNANYTEIGLGTAFNAASRLRFYWTLNLARPR